MAPHWGSASSSTSSKKKGKQRQVEHNRPKSPTPERVFREAMDVDPVSVPSPSPSNPWIPDILSNMGFFQDALMGYQHEICPQETALTESTGDGQQGQPHRSWKPAQPERGELDVMRMEAFEAQAMAGAGLEELGDTSSSYWTGYTFTDDTSSAHMEGLNPGVFEAAQGYMLLADPIVELGIHYTEDGFPIQYTDDGFRYSFQGGSRPYVCQCDGCKKKDRTFMNMSSLAKHQKNHQSEKAKAFKCEICGWTFVLGHYLARHKREHSNERPFGCDACPLRFKRMEQLMRHLGSRSGCLLAWKRWSTASSTDAPQAPGTVSRADQAGPFKSMTEDFEQVEIVSNSSYTFPSARPSGQDF